MPPLIPVAVPRPTTKRKTGLPRISYPKPKRILSPLAVIVPFRDDGGEDGLSQGIGRWANLAEFVPTMCAWLTKAGRAFDILVVEQTPGNPFNKVRSSMPACAWLVKTTTILRSMTWIRFQHTRPTTTRCRRARFTYGQGTMWKPMTYDVVGGVLLMTRADVMKTDGYSNEYGGWGAEDQDMAWRIKHAVGGYDRLDSVKGRYRALPHPRVHGLDETDAFKQNNKFLRRTIAGDHRSGLSTVAFRSVGNHTLPYDCDGSMRSPMRYTVDL